MVLPVATAAEGDAMIAVVLPVAAAAKLAKNSLRLWKDSKEGCEKCNVVCFIRRSISYGPCTWARLHTPVASSHILPAPALRSSKRCL